MFPVELRVSLLPDRFPILCLDSGIVSSLGLRWVKGVYVFRCNLLPALLAKGPGSFTCHCGNTKVERIPNKGQHGKLTRKKKILPPLLPGFELETFRSRVRRSYQQAIPALECRQVTKCLHAHTIFAHLYLAFDLVQRSDLAH